ncbi:MAG: GNAT family N-acetyltransferase [Candidatus Margulisbacteria bacterium]|nr:GNAT family N-acetyltransferase [Candidatus Margulisiibacteriota bacterium]
MTADYEIKSFDCGDSDLNEFFYRDALNYTRQLLAVTYVVETKIKTIGFFSVANDRIQISENNPIWNRLNRNIRNAKRRREYPAVKLGRLGIDREWQNQNVGTELLGYIKELFLQDNKTGCRFITVDAYNNPDTIRFYQKNGFAFFLIQDTREKTRLMFYDLMLYKNANV